MRTFKFEITVTCNGPGNANLDRVEELISLSMQDLVYDDSFIAELDEKEAVTVETILVK
jgi:PHD/YefM family antitoxin component YafN of YafNO toxin-antitoxin module